MAQAILTQDVETLGEKGDVVDVSPGYLRNFLVPRKLAQPATSGSIAEAQRTHLLLEGSLRIGALGDGKLRLVEHAASIEANAGPYDPV